MTTNAITTTINASGPRILAAQDRSAGSVAHVGSLHGRENTSTELRANAVKRRFGGGDCAGLSRRREDTGDRATRTAARRRQRRSGGRLRRRQSAAAGPPRLDRFATAPASGSESSGDPRRGRPVVDPRQPVDQSREALPAEAVGRRLSRLRPARRHGTQTSRDRLSSARALTVRRTSRGPAEPLR